MAADDGWTRVSFPESIKAVLEPIDDSHVEAIDTRFRAIDTRFRAIDTMPGAIETGLEAIDTRRGRRTRCSRRPRWCRDRDPAVWVGVEYDLMRTLPGIVTSAI